MLWQAANLVHLGYALMLCALLARDVLWLRAALVAAQSTLTAYAWLTDRPGMAAWNALFVLINSLWTLRILRERRAVRLPDGLQALYAAHFSALSPAEFLRLWALGADGAAPAGQRLIAEGERPAQLYYLTAGTLRIRQQQRLLTRLRAGDFAGEMSLLTGAPATAEVEAEDGVRFRAWPVPELHELRERQPALWARVQSVLGRDLVNKIQRASVSSVG